MTEVLGLDEATSTVKIAEIFKKYDLDYSNTVDLEEFIAMLKGKE